MSDQVALALVRVPVPLTGARTATLYDPMMNIQDMDLAVTFLKRVVARGTDEDLLLDLIDKMEREVERCRHNLK